MQQTSTTHSQRPTRDSLGDLRRILLGLPAAVGLIGLVAVAMWSLQYGLSLLPVVGSIVGSVVIAFGLGAMYAVANQALTSEDATLTPAVRLLRERWLSLIGAYLLLVGFGVGLILVSALLFFTGGALAAVLDAGLVGFVPAVVVSLAVWLLVVMVAQFFFPAIAVDEIGALDAVTAAGGIVRNQPLSVLGFTLIRLTLEYVPLVLGMVGGAVVVRSALEETLTVLTDTIAEFEEAGTSPEPDGMPDLAAVFFEQATPGALLAAGIVFLTGVVVGEILRILYTTAYYRRVRDTDDESPPNNPMQS